MAKAKERDGMTRTSLSAALMMAVFLLFLGGGNGFPAGAHHRPRRIAGGTGRGENVRGRHAAGDAVRLPRAKHPESRQERGGKAVPGSGERDQGDIRSLRKGRGRETAG